MSDDNKGDVLTALDQYLSSLSNDEWDALTERVRPVVASLDAQLAADPGVIATLEAQIAALGAGIPALDAQIASAEASGKVIVAIAAKQEKYRCQVAVNNLKNELDQRRKANDPLTQEG